MDKFTVQDLLEICEELSISVDLTKKRKNIIDLMQAEEVSIEEASEAQEALQERKAAEAEELENEKVEKAQREERAADREHQLKLKELELRMSTKCPAPTVRE